MCVMFHFSFQSIIILLSFYANNALNASSITDTSTISIPKRFLLSERALYFETKIFSKSLEFRAKKCNLATKSRT